ncbi:FAD dependent oxidoreductase [Desulfofarcimen acetoxidans DSM 771]|uniref:FAD dependent oxidoreductase n=1 Tax=Desulfofarcimen acetoxidans (strain ATCC 49208 / DSM 771 / KCTC 5769 / VKM B-1644 / 5575) TaxID=485916 RepID=C8VVA5_DESAS|nr:FAD dependent oxidoreductase [Desulfofarcimen acetoxidans DSM 771]
MIIVGAGPAGIFSALELIKNQSDLRILIVEKGRDLVNRKCISKEKNISCAQCSPCSIVCGWGGAGAFSDGKLTLSTEVGGTLDKYIGVNELVQLIEYVDSIYVKFGAPDKVYGGDNEDENQTFQRKAVLAGLKLVPILIRHLGTGRCMQILLAMKEHLLSSGVEVLTNCSVESVLTEDKTVTGIKTADGNVYESGYVILAPGREGSSWLSAEADRLGIKTAVNPVDIGVRVELPHSVMKPLTEIFYESKFIYHSKTFEDPVRTFCMNPYGEVVLENNDGLITVNGHSHAYKKTKNTNFAILVSNKFTEPFKEPITYGKNVAALANLLSGGVIIQRLGDLLNGRRTTQDKLERCPVEPTLKEAKPGDLSFVFPYRQLTSILEMLKAMDRIAPGVYSRYTLLYGVEVKFYSSRLDLNNLLETPINNLFAAGDGPGVTRGLAQASAAGVLAARQILKRINQNK